MKSDRNTAGGRFAEALKSISVDKKMDKQWDLEQNPALNMPAVQEHRFTKKIFDLEKRPWVIRGYESVVLEDCVFEGGINHPIYFVDCGCVRIESCVFRNFSGRTLVAENVTGGIEVKDCIFQNCLYKADEEDRLDSLGTVLYSEEPGRIGKVVFDSCFFRRCGGLYIGRKDAAEVICNCRGQVFNCIFDMCGFYKGEYEAGTYMKEKSGKYFFPRNTLVESCKETDNTPYMRVK